MGRVREHIRVNGKLCWTLFDSGSRNTYVTPEVARHFGKVRLDREYKASLGGRRHKIKEAIVLKVEIEGKKVDVESYVIDKLGFDEDKMEIQILFGALAMQKWGIKLDLESERIDLTHYPKEFLEF